VAAGPGAGRITMKMNSLVDPELIEELYAASQAGVEIDLIVRGICCLSPGVPGLSDNVRVRSIVGRYLEHSRIYRFANGDGPGRPRVLIGSADLMPRNLDRRVEVLTPVVDPDLQARLDEVLEVERADDVLAWTLDADGRWTRARPGGEIDTHSRLQDLTVERRGLESKLV
jgi:polyphosphate kinase